MNLVIFEVLFSASWKVARTLSSSWTQLQAPPSTGAAHSLTGTFTASTFPWTQICPFLRILNKVCTGRCKCVGERCCVEEHANVGLYVWWRRGEHEDVVTFPRKPGLVQLLLHPSVNVISLPFIRPQPLHHSLRGITGADSSILPAGSWLVLLAVMYRPHSATHLLHPKKKKKRFCSDWLF